MYSTICCRDRFRFVRHLQCFAQELISLDFFSAHSIRGELNSFIQINCYLGILCGFIAGSYMPYELNPMIMTVLPFVFLFGFVFMPESPQYLLSCNRIEARKRDFIYYDVIC